MVVLAQLLGWLSGLRETREEQGQGMVEYGLIIALIAVVVIGVLTALGTQVQTMFCTVVTTLKGSC